MRGDEAAGHAEVPARWVPIVTGEANSRYLLRRSTRSMRRPRSRSAKSAATGQRSRARGR